MKRAVTIGQITVLSGSILLLATSWVLADLLTSPSDPALAGGELIDFDSLSPGALASPFSLGGVTFTGGIGWEVGATGYGSLPHMSGSYLSNGYFNYNGSHYDPMEMAFSFSEPVQAFGFWLAAANVEWTLTAYDSANTILESQILPATGGSSEAFYGLSVAAGSIDHALLSIGTPGTKDYIFFDQFVSVPATPSGGGDPVPEPATCVLVSAGLLGMFRRVSTKNNG